MRWLASAACRLSLLRVLQPRAKSAGEPGHKPLFGLLQGRRLRRIRPGRPFDVVHQLHLN